MSDTGAGGVGITRESDSPVGPAYASYSSDCVLSTLISHDARVRNHNSSNSNSKKRGNGNNNNPIQERSVFFRDDALAPRGASPPRSEELNHPLPSRWPNPTPALPLHVVRTPHLHGAPTTQETSIVKL